MKNILIKTLNYGLLYGGILIWSLMHYFVYNGELVFWIISTTLITMLWLTIHHISWIIKGYRKSWIYTDKQLEER